MNSTGVKLYGEGEWKVRLHGKEKRRTWRKLHLLLDHTTHEAVACSMSEQYVLDRKELPGLLKRVEGEVAEVLGDGAYDFQDCYRALDGVGARGHPAAGAGASQERGGVPRQECGGAARA